MLDHPANSSFSPGCFNATEQVTIVAQSCGASQVAIVGCQFFHIWMCKTRRISLFQHGITNLSTIVAVIVEICLVAVFIYVPGVNFVLGVSPPTGYVYLAPLILGVLIWGFNEWRKFHIRNWPRTILAKVLKW